MSGSPCFCGGSRGGDVVVKVLLEQGIPLLRTGETSYSGEFIDVLCDGRPFLDDVASIIGGS